MPQPRSSRPNTRSTSSSRSRSTQPKAATGGSRAATKRAPSSGTPKGTKAKSRPAQEKASASSGDARLEAAAQRIRKLNERIIEAGKDTGEATLSSYEKALKAIASALERGAGSTDVEWISQLASTQAKFIRDMTEAWTSAARSMLK